MDVTMLVNKLSKSEVYLCLRRTTIMRQGFPDYVKMTNFVKEMLETINLSN